MTKDKKASPKETVNHFENNYDKVFAHSKPFHTKDYYLRVLDKGIDFVLDNYLDLYKFDWLLEAKLVEISVKSSEP